MVDDGWWWPVIIGDDWWWLMAIYQYLSWIRFTQIMIHHDILGAWMTPWSQAMADWRCFYGSNTFPKHLESCILNSNGCRALFLVTTFLVNYVTSVWKFGTAVLALWLSIFGRLWQSLWAQLFPINQPSWSHANLIKNYTCSFIHSSFLEFLGMFTSICQAICKKSIPTMLFSRFPWVPRSPQIPVDPKSRLMHLESQIHGITQPLSSNCMVPMMKF